MVYRLPMRIQVTVTRHEITKFSFIKDNLLEVKKTYTHKTP